MHSTNWNRTSTKKNGIFNMVFAQWFSLNRRFVLCLTKKTLAKMLFKAKIDFTLKEKKNLKPKREKKICSKKWNKEDGKFSDVVFKELHFQYTKNKSIFEFIHHILTKRIVSNSFFCLNYNIMLLNTSSETLSILANIPTNRTSKKLFCFLSCIESGNQNHSSAFINCMNVFVLGGMELEICNKLNEQNELKTFLSNVKRYTGFYLD